MNKMHYFSHQGVSNLKNSHFRMFGSLKIDLDIVWVHRLLSRLDMSLGKSTNTHGVLQQPLEHYLQPPKAKQLRKKTYLFRFVHISLQKRGFLPNDCLALSGCEKCSNGCCHTTCVFVDLLRPISIRKSKRRAHTMSRSIFRDPNVRNWLFFRFDTPWWEK